MTSRSPDQQEENTGGERIAIIPSCPLAGHRGLLKGDGLLGRLDFGLKVPHPRPNEKTARRQASRHGGSETAKMA